MDMYGFYTGKSFDAYEYFGAHLCEGGVVFRTFAPQADHVDLLLGNEGRIVPMNRVGDGNVHEVYVDGVREECPYEYRIYKRSGGWTDHCDPYGFGMELRPAHRSIVRDMGGYEFRDQNWMRDRTDRLYDSLNIYEMHAGSWRKPNEDEWYTYDELAPILIPYLKENGFNYVEFLPLSEHPVDQSWGYQNTGFFSPTSRYGTADQLKKLIDELHLNGIGAIIDYVPVHFAIDDYGLGNYDGTALYEYPNDAVGVSEWGSYNFMHSRGEVCSFLQSCANYWLKEFHFDGLRMDAISRIIYWQGDQARGVNGNAVDFLKNMNATLKHINPGCLLAAEDSTSIGGVTKPVHEGGLGFDYKWDMGWMNDTLNFFRTGPLYRPHEYHKLTFSMMYYHDENFMLPLSHDENVHGKATVLQKMAGDYEEKFPQGRALYMYMVSHPGKMLNFMGAELGQLREWDEKREQDWDILKYPNHDNFHKFCRDLNHLYLKNNALFEWDYVDEGFNWLDCHQEERVIYAFERRSPKQRIAAIFNLSDQVQTDYVVEIPEGKKVSVLLDTDEQQYGGQTKRTKTKLTFEGKNKFTFKDGKLTVTLPAYSGLLLEVK